jgi:hypothetical protein
MRDETKDDIRILSPGSSSFCNSRVNLIFISQLSSFNFHFLNSTIEFYVLIFQFPYLT